MNAVGTIVTGHKIERRAEIAKLNLPTELEKFVGNTLEYAAREKDVILGRIEIPPLPVDCSG